VLDEIVVNFASPSLECPLLYAHFTSYKAWNKGYPENVCISQGIGGEGSN
jgi:hypothetical protein